MNPYLWTAGTVLASLVLVLIAAAADYGRCR